MGATIEKYRNSNNEHYYIMPWCSILPIIVLLSYAIVLFLNSLETDICRKVSPHVYNFVLSIIAIPAGIFAIAIAIANLGLMLITLSIAYIFNC